MMKIFTVEYTQACRIQPNDCQIGQGGWSDQTITLA